MNLFGTTGQDRRAWLDRTGENALAALQYYAGPGLNLNALATIADAFNPVSDIGRAGTSARGVVRPGATAMERVGALGNVATDMASVLAPMAGAAYADDAARGLTEGLANWTMPADDMATRFMASEYGGIGRTPRDYPIAARDEWYGDANYETTGGRIEYMTPQEFLDQVRPLELDDVARDNIDDLKNHIGSGRTLDPLQIAANGREDGRHRAYAAMELGIDRVPVLRWGNAAPSRSPAEAQAQTVLDLLASGRASEVTDDMLAAADPQYLYRNYDLPMDEASRMARAREMGFDTDTPLYHGTRRDFPAFDPAAPKSSDHGWYGDGAYLGNAELASEYAMSGPKEGRNVVPVVTRGRQMNWPEGNPAFMTADDAAEGTRSMKALGYSGVDVRVPEGFDDAGALHERLVFDPRNIRSRFARFDPRLSHLRNLSAGVGGLGIMASQSEDERSEDINALLAKYGL